MIVRLILVEFWVFVLAAYFYVLTIHLHCIVLAIDTTHTVCLLMLHISLRYTIPHYCFGYWQHYVCRPKQRAYLPSEIRLRLFDWKHIRICSVCTYIYMGGWCVKLSYNNIVETM